MAFRCFGFFGPVCPTRDLLFFVGNGGLGINEQQIPLELAMKLFWCASSYTVNAEMTRTTTDPDVPPELASDSASRSITAIWGGINGFPISANNRPAFTRASQMLCHISSGPNTPHTFARASGGGQATIQFSLGKQMIFDGDKGIKLPLNAFLDIGPTIPTSEVLIGVRPYTSQTNLSWQTLPFQANVFTPWGDFSLPIFTRTNPEFYTVTGSMTITVSEANLEDRFAGLLA